ncbi:MAG: IS630 family transposase [Bacteroidia bacterium]|nr:IS630 family transposase [Bacteroidia bacterium]
MNSFLTDNDRDYLRMQHRQMKETRYADRIKTILFLDKGDSYSEVAERLMLDDATIRNYYQQYEKNGLSDLLKDEYTGKSCYLSEQQLSELDAHASAHIYTDSKELANYIEKTYGVTYTQDAVKKLLHRLDYVYKKPKLIPGKADAAKQQKFVEEYEQLKQTKKPEDKIFFMDGVHPMHNVQPAYGWIKRGEEKALKSNTGRERVNINGAYNIEDHSITVREDESINAQSTIALFEQLLKKHPLGTLNIIHDNARYYRCNLITEFLKTHQRIAPKYLPSYSPNLNLIERLWGFFKSEITHNHYYEKFADFKKASMGFFENIKDYRKELETLMTENFHIRAVPVINSS